jgi:two-component system CitB family sensor kinase
VSDRTRLPDRLVDPRGLVTVVGNLVDNALDAVAGTPHARVEVELRAEGRAVTLTVRDTGPGVPQEHRELVFAEGWSTKKPPAHRRRGIGLSLVRRLAERQGGSATVRAAHGGGAEFVVFLPEALTDADPEPALTAPVRPAGPDGDGPDSTGSVSTAPVNTVAEEESR